MSEKGFYHPNIGYWQTSTEPTEEIRQGYPQGTVEVPLKPSPLHKLVDNVWVEPTQEEIDTYEGNRVRGQRNFLLISEVDPVVMNSLRWNSMTATQQQAWADYRQALLDITDQAGFPHDVTWPTKPSA